MLAVSDTGIGMDQAIQLRIFEPFFTTKEKGKGTGLGLSTVYGIVKQSGGNVWVYSEPQQGTSFKVYLPQIDAEVEGDGAPAAVLSIKKGSETVLLVEDEDMVRNLATELLKENGYNVLAASGGVEVRQVPHESGGNRPLVGADVLHACAPIRPQLNVNAGRVAARSRPACRHRLGVAGQDGAGRCGVARDSGHCRRRRGGGPVWQNDPERRARRSGRQGQPVARPEEVMLGGRVAAQGCRGRTRQD